jgi:hypothetical protein
MKRREHWGACLVRVAYPSQTVTHAWPYPTMEGAIMTHDPFQHTTHWPLCNVGNYLGRMGVVS